MSISSVNSHGPAMSPAIPSAFDSPLAAMPTISDAQSNNTGAQTRKQPTSSDMIEAVKTLNKFVETASQGIRFSIDDDTGRTVVKIIDVEKQTVLRQIPSLEALSIAKSLDRLQGLLIREKA